MRHTLLIIICCFFTEIVFSQTDSTANILSSFNSRYFNNLATYTSQYHRRLSKKTIKTIEKCAKWENKLRKLIKKFNPEAEQKLFDKSAITFSNVLKQINNTESGFNNQRLKFNELTDKLQTNIAFIDSNKNLLQYAKSTDVQKLKAEIHHLDSVLCNTEQIKQFIKKRKADLGNALLKQTAKIPALKKINKETYYYLETVKNYKEVFKDKSKKAILAQKILRSIPGFEKFENEHSLLSTLFPKPSGLGSGVAIAGLQTRESIHHLLNNQFNTNGRNGMEFIQKQLQNANKELQDLKQKILPYSANSSNVNIPEGFKPNTQKTKTFKQRLEYGLNFQFSKTTGILPGLANIGASIGYKLNDKSTAGIGLIYNLGISKNSKFKLSHEGIGIRTFADWKIKKNWYLTSSYELNHFAAFTKLNAIDNAQFWKQSALLGLSKKYQLNKKLKGNLQLMYNFLSNSSLPISSPFVYRVGYNF